MRIRMKKDISTRIGAFTAGQVIELEDVLARSWVGFGLAEEEKSISQVPETKVHRGISGHAAGPNVTLGVEQGTSPFPVPPPGVGAGLQVKPEIGKKIEKPKRK
jgi:hypothetical protein